MSGTSAKANIPYADLTDVPDAAAITNSMAVALDNMVIPKYSTVASRDSENPSPTQGDVCYCSDIDVLFLFDGGVSKWVYLNEKVLSKTSDTTYTSNTTPAIDPHLQFPAEASSKYNCEYTLFVASGSTTPDLNIAWSLPTSATINFGFIAPETAATGFNGIQVIINALQNQTAPATQVAGIGGGAVTMVKVWLTITTVTAGTFGIKLSQNVSSGTSVVVKSGSFMTFKKYA